jgi:hypothetical protein
MIPFPQNPTVGQLFTHDGRTWRWNGAGWVAQGAPGGGGLDEVALTSTVRTFSAGQGYTTTALTASVVTWNPSTQVAPTFTPPAGGQVVNLAGGLAESGRFTGVLRVANPQDRPMSWDNNVDGGPQASGVYPFMVDNGVVTVHHDVDSKTDPAQAFSIAAGAVSAAVEPLEQGLVSRLRVDAAQGLDAGQQATGRGNIDAASPADVGAALAPLEDALEDRPTLAELAGEFTPLAGSTWALSLDESEKVATLTDDLTTVVVTGTDAWPSGTLLVRQDAQGSRDLVFEAPGLAGGVAVFGGGADGTVPLFGEANAETVVGVARILDTLYVFSSYQADPPPGRLQDMAGELEPQQIKDAEVVRQFQAQLTLAIAQVTGLQSALNARPTYAETTKSGWGTAAPAPASGTVGDVHWQRDDANDLVHYWLKGSSGWNNPFSLPMTVGSPASPPGAPETFSIARVGEDSIRAPGTGSVIVGDTGGSPIIGYRFQLWNNFTNTQVGGTVSQPGADYLWTAVPEGIYHVRVAAYNDVGTGLYTQSSNTVNVEGAQVPGDDPDVALLYWADHALPSAEAVTFAAYDPYYSRGAKLSLVRGDAQTTLVGSAVTGAGAVNQLETAGVALALKQSPSPDYDVHWLSNGKGHGGLVLGSDAAGTRLLCVGVGDTSPNADRLVAFEVNAQNAETVVAAGVGTTASVNAGSVYALHASVRGSVVTVTVRDTNNAALATQTVDLTGWTPAGTYYGWYRRAGTHARIAQLHVTAPGVTVPVVSGIPRVAVLYPEAATYVRGGADNLDVNFNGADTLGASSASDTANDWATSANRAHTFLRFDLSALANRGALPSVWLHVRRSTSSGEGTALQARRIPAVWDPAAMTAGNTVALGAQNPLAPFGDTAAMPLVVAAGSVDRGNYFLGDVTALAQAAVTAGAPLAVRVRNTTDSTFRSYNAPARGPLMGPFLTARMPDES